VLLLEQVFLNYRLKSTDGWNIWNVLLDFEGGILSLAQQLLDSEVTKDFSPITGNPVKFGLG
jgi:cystinosin